jgi:hypothetical protein
MCLAPKAQHIHRQSARGRIRGGKPGAARQDSWHAKKALALKARFTGDVIRSIIGTALIFASGMFGIESHH